MSKKVSVIIPVYNGYDNIKKAINSVLEQSYKPYEIIIIDDASTDNTQEQIPNNKLIKYKRLNSNVGGGEARNVGLKLAKGDLIAFLDSDDIWFKNKLMIQVNYWINQEKNHNLIVSCHSLSLPYNIKIPKNEYNSKNGLFENMFFSSGMFQTSSLLIPSSILKNIRFSDIKVHQDYDFIIKCQINNIRIEILPDALYYFTSDNFSNRISTTFNALDSLHWVIRKNKFFTADMINYYINKYNIFERLSVQNNLHKNLYISIVFIFIFF